jgi:hypothetical protein
MSLVVVGLVAPADSAARRVITGPSEIYPGKYVVFDVTGFLRHRRDIYTTLTPGDCPALDTCTNTVGRDSRVNQRGRGHVRFHWPITFVGFDANMVSRRYPWSGQTSGAVKVCTFPGPPKCANKEVRITSPAAPSANAVASEVQPRIASLRWREQGVGPPGPGYRVRESITLRACAVRGRLAIRVREQKQGFDGTVVAEHFRKFRVRQKRRCQRHEVAWRLGDRFFGIGKYVVRTSIVDAFGRESAPVFRSSKVTD